MTIDILTICDSAHVYNDHMVVVNPFSLLKQDTLPVKYPSMCLACRLVYNNSDIEGSKYITIKLLSPSGKTIINTIKGKFGPIQNIETLKPLNLIVGFNNTLLEEEGMYSFKVEIGRNTAENNDIVEKERNILLFVKKKDKITESL